MIIKIAAYLKQKSKPVETEERIQVELITKLLDEISKVHGGALGLSAIQIGIPKTAFIMHNSMSGEFDAYINPKLVSASKEILNYYEGCLSFPKDIVLTDRYAKIIVVDLIHGEQELAGLDAIVWQHEFDHGRGVLFFNRKTRIKDKSQWRFPHQSYVEENN